MRTTLSIDSALLQRAKTRAAQRGQSLGQYIESVIRRDLVLPRVHRPSPELPVFTRGTGMCPGIDPSSNGAIYSLLDTSGDPA